MFVFARLITTTSTRLSSLVWTSLLLAPGLSYAQAPKAPSTYTETARQGRQAKLEEIMQILYLQDKFKSPFDEVKIQEGRAVVKVWRDLPAQPSTERVECLGYQWLLSGRGKKMGYGVGRVFQDFPNLQSVDLELYELDFEVESVDGRGKLKRKTLPKRYLRYRILRDQAGALVGKNERLKKELSSSLGRCLSIGRRVKIDKEIVL